jgi:PAS domain S-box-containing protein
MLDDLERRVRERTAKLDRANRELEEAQRVAHIGSWEWNLVENTVRWSKQLHRIHGIDPGEFEGTYEAFLANVHPDDRERVNEVVSRAFNRRTSFDFDHRCIRPDGDVRLLYSRGDVVVDEVGDPIGMRGTCQDVTELRKAEQSVRRLAAIVESTDDAIFSTSPDGAIDTWNPGAERLYGFTEQEVVGRSVAVLLPQEMAEETNAMLGRALRGEQLINFESRHVTKEGASVDVIVTVSPIKDARGEISGCAFIVGDVSELKRVQHEADRMKDEFFATLSHELRTPLTSIIGYTHLLLDGAAGGLNPEQRQFLEITERNAKRQLRLVSDLLLASSLEVSEFFLNFGPVQLAAVVSDAVGGVRAVAEDRAIQLEVDVPPSLECDGDADRLGQMVDNLLTNAVKFTPHGGRIELALFERDGTVIIEVRNSGSYIPAAERERLFERFFRGSIAEERAVSGVGLGLTIARAIVVGHGGSIEVDSSVEAGTTFRIYLPVARDAPGAGGKRRVSAAPTR